MVVRVSPCSSREEGESAECGRASTRCGRVPFGCSLMMISFCRRVSECGRASARCCRVSLGCSSMISFCRRVSDCEELESDKLEGAEEGDIVKISTACSV
jgi:hypothetical protein